MSASALLPREHGLWCWVGVPLLAALALRPSPGAALGGLSLLALFGAGNALRARAWLPAGGAWLGAVALCALARRWLPASPDLAWTFGVAHLGLLLLPGSTSRGPASAHTAAEMLIIAGAALGGAALAAAAGAPAEAALLLALLLCCWQVIGLWWLRGQLSRLLPGRQPWGAGPLAIGLLALCLLLLSLQLGQPLVALLCLLYPLRARLMAPAHAARDARRLGLTELAWTAAVALAGAGLLRGAT